jgi:hypothetical protein
MDNIIPANGKSSLLRVIKFYSLLWKSTYGRSPTIEYGRVGKALKPLFENYTEYQLALMLMQFFQWKGANDNDNFQFHKLSNNAFPITWFPVNADAIAVYIQNVLHINLNDLSTYKHIVDQKFRDINK